MNPFHKPKNSSRNNKSTEHANIVKRIATTFIMGLSPQLQLTSSILYMPIDGFFFHLDAVPNDCY